MGSHAARCSVEDAGLCLKKVTIADAKTFTPTLTNETWTYIEDKIVMPFLRLFSSTVDEANFDKRLALLTFFGWHSLREAEAQNARIKAHNLHPDVKPMRMHPTHVLTPQASFPRTNILLADKAMEHLWEEHGLREKIELGQPYQRELAAIREESDETSDITSIIDSAEPFSALGVKSAEWLSVTSRQLAAALESAAATPRTSTVTKSIFERLKFQDGAQSTLPPVAPAPVTNQPTDVQTIANNFLKHVSAARYGDALASVDAALARIPQGTKASDAAVTAAEEFKAAVIPRVATTQLLSFLDSSLVMMRYSFVERILDEFHAQAPSASSSESDATGSSS